MVAAEIEEEHRSGQIVNSDHTLHPRVDHRHVQNAPNTLEKEVLRQSSMRT